VSASAPPPGLESRRPLAPLTTLGLGGPAEHFLAAARRDQIVDALRWAQAVGKRVGVLGGGSNLVISDRGFHGLVLQLATRGVALSRAQERVRLEVQAGERWDDVVALALDEGLAGLECLTGIPGSAGATPIQNVGAYGQEISQCLEAVEVLDRQTLAASWWPRERCAFGYRDSFFKRNPERFVVLAVRFLLDPGGEATVRYPELAAHLGLPEGGRTKPSLREVAAAVRALRAAKSMLLVAGDEDARSAGSFFTNPIVPREQAEDVRRRALALGLVARAEDVPCYDAGPDRRKLAAAWLIERAGIAKGLRRGAVGVSSKHSLALVHHGGGSSDELLALAEEIRARVRASFGVTLELEPVCW
jgi:UDP-N-acetylmuramate dehydrogenase